MSICVHTTWPSAALLPGIQTSADQNELVGLLLYVRKDHGLAVLPAYTSSNQHQLAGPHLTCHPAYNCANWYQVVLTTWPSPAMLPKYTFATQYHLVQHYLALSQRATWHTLHQTSII